MKQPGLQTVELHAVFRERVADLPEWTKPIRLTVLMLHHDETALDIALDFGGVDKPVNEAFWSPGHAYQAVVLEASCAPRVSYLLEPRRVLSGELDLGSYLSTRPVDQKVEVSAPRRSALQPEHDSQTGDQKLAELALCSRSKVDDKGKGRIERPRLDLTKVTLQVT